jgi:hypothetical protein
MMLLPVLCSPCGVRRAFKRRETEVSARPGELRTDDFPKDQENRGQGPIFLEVLPRPDAGSSRRREKICLLSPFFYISLLLPPIGVNRRSSHSHYPVPITADVSEGLQGFVGKRGSLRSAIAFRGQGILFFLHGTALFGLYMRLSLLIFYLFSGILVRIFEKIKVPLLDLHSGGLED